MKRTIALLLTGIMAFSLSACGAGTSSTEETAGTETSAEAVAENSADDAAEETSESEAEASVEETEEESAAEEESSEEETGLANPWSECSAEEASELVPRLFKMPDGAENVVWSKLDSEVSPLVQAVFELEGDTFTAREQGTGDEADISGLYYEWTEEDEATLSNWGGGAMTAKTYRYVGDEGYVDLCTWYDVETGYSYSLSVEAPDLDGFDILGVVDQMYDPDADMDEEAMLEDEHEPLDITGCDTFTQIVDMMPEGYGFANSTIGGTDVLLVTDYVYDNDGEGTLATINADVYYYDNDGVPTYAGYVTSGGTAYPLAVADGKLYCAGNHFVRKMDLQDGKLVIDEEAYVNYDTNGDGTYYLSSETHEVEADENGQVADDTVLNSMFDELFEAEVIVFAKD